MLPFTQEPSQLRLSRWRHRYWWSHITITYILRGHVPICSCHKPVFLWPGWECRIGEEGVEEENNPLCISGVCYYNYKRQWTGSKLGKEYIKVEYYYPVYLTYAEYIMWNAGQGESQAGIKIVRKNIYNLTYTDDTTLTESEEELKSLLMRVKEESEKADLKLNIQKTKIVASGPITSWQIDGETMHILYFFELQNHCGCWLLLQN